VPHHPQPGYKRDAHMDKSIIIHIIIQTPSRVSLQTFINFVYLYVNKQFTTQTLLNPSFLKLVDFDFIIGLEMMPFIFIED
jgi:hypothetical protein